MNNFYINRLKTFSVAEFPYRVKQMLIKQLEERVYYNKTFPSLRLDPAKPLLDTCIINAVPHPNEINFFGKQFNYDNIKPTDWHRDIFSDKVFPLSFSKKINIRKDPELSAKAVWEINRLQFLMKISLAYQQSKNINELNLFIKIVKSWKAGNPYLAGVNWYSNIEVNLRLITWFLCWEVIGADNLIKENDKFNSFVTEVWLPLIYQHCIYSHKNPSKYSSANNHLISEYAGLFIASSKWPFRESEKWIAYSQRGLEDEIIKQHSKRGVNKEEAAEYIQFITDFFLLAYVVAENSGRPFSKQYKDKLYDILKYICDFLDIKGNFPKYGDEDDGKCFIVDFGEEGFNNFKSLLTSGAIIFKDPFLKSKSNGFDIKNQLLFGKGGKKIYDEIPVVNLNNEGSTFYTEEGHFILRKRENHKEVYLHFDAAPLGFLSIAAHGHADALSFLLNVDGQPVFADPGTYTYHTEPEWRNYFIGTLAHNTVRINRLDQATIAGSTLWLQHFQCSVLRAETNDLEDIIKARHNGYERHGITHTREIIFNKKLLQVKISDTIESKNRDEYFIEVPFHLHPSVEINTVNNNSFKLVIKPNRNVHLKMDDKLKGIVVRGQIDPGIIGWYSGSFMHKEPSDTIIGTMQASGTIQLVTMISII